jgi:type IV pilus assembly protein PilA
MRKTSRILPLGATGGFTLVELLIVMSVVLILMVLVIPSFQHYPQRIDEATTIGSLHTLNEMEGEYNSIYPQHGYACSLKVLGGKSGSATPTAQSAQLIKEELSSGRTSGYIFSITSCDKTTVNGIDHYSSYQIKAVPISVGHSGNRGFCTDETAKIYFDPQGGTNCTELLQ